MSDTKAYPPWVPAVNGTGQHPWFLIRGNEQTVPPADRYLLRADGQLRHFASMENAQKYADKINANLTTLPTPRFKPGDKVTYFSTVTRHTMQHGTVMDEGRLTRDETDDPDELVYRVYRVKDAGSPTFPPDAGVGTPWPEESMLHGWLNITDPTHIVEKIAPDGEGQAVFRALQTGIDNYYDRS